MRVTRQIFLSTACSLVVLTMALPVAAQIVDWPVPTLVDEIFHVPPCDEMLARIDNFYLFLNKAEAEEGLVEITGSHEHLIDKLRLEVRFVSGGSFRGWTDKPRVTVVRGEETGDTRMRFWSVPTSNRRPDVSPTAWDMTIPSGTKPFFF